MQYYCPGPIECTVSNILGQKKPSISYCKLHCDTKPWTWKKTTKTRNLKIFTLFIVSSIKQEFIILPFQFCYIFKGLVQNHVLALPKKIYHLKVSLKVKNLPEETESFGFTTYIWYASFQNLKQTIQKLLLLIFHLLSIYWASTLCQALF